MVNFAVGGTLRKFSNSIEFTFCGEHKGSFSSINIFVGTMLKIEIRSTNQNRSTVNPPSNCWSKSARFFEDL